MLLGGAGDLVLMRPLEHVRRRPPDSLLPLISQADLSVANLEVALVPSVQAPDPPGLWADSALLPDLLALRFSALSLANNHCGDPGSIGVEWLTEQLRSAGVKVLGVGADPEAAVQPVLIPVQGSEVALVAASCVAGRDHFARPGRPGLAGVAVETRFRPDRERLSWEPGAAPLTDFRIQPDDLRRLLHAVHEAARRAPVVIAVMHWGVSHRQRPEAYQRDLGRQLVEAGATAVLGSHAHELQGVEIHRGHPIFYGLGSFVFGYSGPLAPRMPRDTALALLDVDDGGSLRSARLMLGQLDAAGEPVRAHPERVAHLAEQLRRTSVGWSAELRQEDDTLHIIL